MKLTKELLRELADAGVESLNITVDNPEALAAELAPDVDFGLGTIKESVSITTVGGAPAVSRSRSGMGWLRREGKPSLTVFVRSPATVAPLPLATQAA